MMSSHNYSSAIKGCFIIFAQKCRKVDGCKMEQAIGIVCAGVAFSHASLEVGNLQDLSNFGS